jgi:NADH-ubiquinone oxidoreductase chain 5
MAAPTPVSALVHSSTLVTAGVFLLIRFHSTISQFPYINLLLLTSASLTILIAGISASTECDLKKIIALSTLSQLGVIIARIALNQPILAFFHLITHALFKALLFICAGSFIDLHLHNQDLRKTGNAVKPTPLISSCFLIANISLCGTPFLAGFYSKDLILETSLYSTLSIFTLTIFFIATRTTIIYTIRFILNLMWGPPNSHPINSINDTDLNISIPVVLLTVGAISIGSILN